MPTVPRCIQIDGPPLTSSSSGEVDREACCELGNAELTPQTAHWQRSQPSPSIQRPNGFWEPLDGRVTGGARPKAGWLWRKG